MNSAEEAMDVEKSTSSILGDVAIVATLLLAGGYYLMRKRKKPEFEADLIQTIPIDATRTRKNSETESGFIGKLKESNTNVVIFYGSQTGTAEEFANRLSKEAPRYALKGKPIDPEECDMEKISLIPSMINNHVAIFCMATYGEGDPTDNSKEFYDMLENDSDSLRGLNYAVFGLGNKTYEHYNAAAIYVDKRLADLGANRVHELGLGDDDANIEEDFMVWKENMWDSVCKLYGLEPADELMSQRQYEIIRHEPGQIPDEKVFKGEINRLGVTVESQQPPYDAKNPFLAKVTTNRNLFKSGDRSCMHIEIDITGSSMRYESGDHIGIYCRSEEAIVTKLGKLLDIDLDEVITMKNLDKDSSKKSPFPCPTTLRAALTYYVDINQLPTTYILKELSEYTDNADHKKMLKLMSSYSEEGKALYAEWIVKECRNVVHLMEDLPSVKPPIDHLLELLPRLQPRFYSISSSPKYNKDSVHVTAVLVDYFGGPNNNRPIKGVCTNFLTGRLPGKGDEAIVACYLRKSQFRLPPKTETPVIMIGPGTGVAPFRGFLQERDHFRKEGRTMGDTILYYGCRKRAEDYLYEEELEEYKKNGTLTQLYTACSRDQPEKIYVTHLLKQNKDEVWDVIGKRGGHLYVCGDAKAMARSVRDIILDIVQEKGQMSKTEAEAFFKKMEAQRKYSADVWS
ncbi:NADPH--cytochrome P450 reductase [Halotydeus destructor]|nr:NADPH--cytochrome P450 reductase [Halotydeus destructor]